jgi:hypothetical protein
MSAAMDQVDALTRQHAQSFHGFLTLRLIIGPDGKVRSVERLCDRILPLTRDTSGLEPFKQEIARLLATVQFPASGGVSAMTAPVLVGN